MIPQATNPSVTVIIPCYNSGRTLPFTLDSLRIQTYQPLEIIVIDDGSTDPDTIAYVDSLSDVRVVRQENKGLPSARNAGFRAAASRYVLPLDADDWLEPDAVAKLMHALLTNNDAHYTYSHMQLEGEAKGILAKRYNFFEQLFFNQMPYCLMLPKALWAEIGGYDESMRRGYEDWDFNIRLGATGCTGVVVPEPLFHYRVSSGGMLLSTSTKHHGDLWRQIQLKNRELFSPRTLIALWRRWRRRPSTYPLVFYFGWLSLHRLLPKRSFQALFRQLMLRSHGRRVTERSR